MGRKNARWDIRLGLRTIDSKAPGSMIDGIGAGSGSGSGSGSVSLGSEAVESALSRLLDKYRFLLKSKCSNSGVRESNRYGREPVTILENNL